MIDVKYVLQALEFKPTKALDRAAAYDIKAYISEPLTTAQISKIKNYAFNAQSDIYIDGTLYVEPSQHLNSKLNKAVVLFPSERKIVSAGFKVQLSTDNANCTATMLVCARSGLACKHGILVANAPGIVDENYPDTVGVGLFNTSDNIHIFTHGARIAQVMFVESLMPNESIVDELAQDGSRTGGFGSTGI